MFKENGVWHNSQAYHQLKTTFVTLARYFYFVIFHLQYVYLLLVFCFVSFLRHYIEGIRQSVPFEAPSAREKTLSPSS